MIPEVRHVVPEVRHVIPEAYCYRSYCYNMHLDPGQQAPSCTSLPSEAYQVLPENAYEALLLESHAVMILQGP